MLVMSRLLVVKWLHSSRHHPLTLPFVLSRNKEYTGKKHFCVSYLVLLLLLFCWSQRLSLFGNKIFPESLPPPPRIFLLMPHSPEVGHMLTNTASVAKGNRPLFWFRPVLIHSWGLGSICKCEPSDLVFTDPCYIVKLYENIQPVFFLI